MAELNDPLRLDQFSNALLDVTPDTVLDACVREAATLVGAPIALVSLVMRHIQFFRAQTGLPPELAMSLGTSRCNSFCQRVVERDAPLIINDTAQDSRLPKELVEHYGIRAYLGVPVLYGTKTLGSLCVIDGKPRDFGPPHVTALRAIGERVSRRLAEMGLAVPQLATSPPGPVPGREAILDIALNATVLERALLEVRPVVQSVARLDSSAYTSDAIGKAIDIAREAGLVYEDAVLVTHEMRHLLERAGTEASDEDMASLVAALRTLERSLAEAGPLVRLVRGADRLTDDQLARAVRVVRQALGFLDEALQAVDGLRNECLRLADRMALLTLLPCPRKLH